MPSQLLRNRKLNNEPLTSEYEGEPMDDSIPDVEEIIRALFKLCNRKTSGMTCITAELIKSWYFAAKPPEKGQPDLRGEEA